MSTFCFEEDVNDIIINKFVLNFIMLSSNSIYREKDLLNVLNYQLNELINNRKFQYYTTDSSFNFESFMKYFVLLNSEGVILTSQKVILPLKKSKTPLSTKFSFRYDQMIDC